MNNAYPRHLTILALILVTFAAFLAGYRARDFVRPAYAALATPNDVLSLPTLNNTASLRPVELFQEALQQVQANYVEQIKDPEKLVYAAIHGMLLPLNDPYTRYMEPKDYTEFNSDNQGSFAGIGATLSMVELPAQEVKDGEGTLPAVVCPVCGNIISNIKHYRVAIVEPLPGSPAKAAGLQAGDFVLKVDDKSTDGETTSEVAEQIRGKIGTKVKLTVARKGIEKPLELEITRQQIEVPSVETKMLDGNIGYLRMMTFNEKTFNETRAGLLSLKKDGAVGLVLDLRNNPGGLLTQCIKVAGLLLNEDNKLVVQTKPRKGNDVPYNRYDKQIWEKPMVVLVNKGSASASEILSGALKDYKRAKIIGETTFGKALVQTVIPLSDGSAMAITTAHYYTPNGYDVGKKGVPPDITVALDKDVQFISEKDNQAQEAIKILKNEMATAAH